MGFLSPSRLCSIRLPEEYIMNSKRVIQVADNEFMNVLREDCYSRRLNCKKVSELLKKNPGYFWDK